MTEWRIGPRENVRFVIIGIVRKYLAGSVIKIAVFKVHPVDRSVVDLIGPDYIAYVIHNQIADRTDCFVLDKLSVKKRSDLVSELLGVVVAPIGPDSWIINIKLAMQYKNPHIAKNKVRYICIDRLYGLALSVEFIGVANKIVFIIISFVRIQSADAFLFGLIKSLHRQALVFFRTEGRATGSIITGVVIDCRQRTLAHK
jgi:hypothetical protein